MVAPPVWRAVRAATGEGAMNVRSRTWKDLLVGVGVICALLGATSAGHAGCA